MAKFDMGAAWDDSIALLRSHTTLTGTIAAVFLFLPSLAVAWFGPAPIEPVPGATLDQVMAALRENIWQILPYQLAVALFALVGTLAILRLWLARSATSVGEALSFSLVHLLTMIALQIVLGIMLGVAFLLLVIPCLYLIGRLALVSPIIADRGTFNPIEAIGESWRMTRGNGWAIFFFLFLVTVVLVVVLMIVAGVVGLITGNGPGFGHMVSGFLESAIGVVATMVSLAISAAAYRQLASAPAPSVFE